VVEFKSDRHRLPDDELVEALACLANTQGGELWLGVEDDGVPTGLHEAHRDVTGLPGLVAARTSPSLAGVGRGCRDCRRARGAYRGAACRFHRLRRRRASICIAASGRDGQPECVPMLPHDRKQSRQPSRSA
jgi:ATP-dependent DNA helicase RecG